MKSLSVSNSIYRAIFIILVILLVCIGIIAGIRIFNVTALPAQDFKAGRIIDDVVFYNKDAMNAQQIQAFLDRQIPNCDVWGTERSEYGGGSRAQYAASVGWHAPPYVCLNKYYENPNTGDTSYEHGGGTFAGGISAAQIIYNAAQRYGINPQVLLVLLKKESAGPLTSDTWPLKSQYRYAMGYACPDSGPNNTANCNSKQAGFYKQIEMAAWQLKYYKDHPNDYRYSLGWNNIQYSPNLACGTKRVNIENIATLSLYIYTPYTPNDGALANYPGTSHCGAYGNRNFYMFFREWFGDPSYTPPTCDAKMPDTVCVWRLYDPTYGSEFLTTSVAERDYVVRNLKYSYQDIAFYAFKSQKPGTIPVYRMNLPTQHFFTASTSEVNWLVAQGPQNASEGVAFYAYPASDKGNATLPIFRVSDSYRGHILTANLAERDSLVRSGSQQEGIAFNTPSGQASTSIATDNRLNIYRLNGPQGYFYTSSLYERDQFIRRGWGNEAILFQAPPASTSLAVRRFSKNAGEYMFTASNVEKNVLLQNGWLDEGIAWYVDQKTPQIYRFKINERYFYTGSLSEAAAISNKLGAYEGIAFGTNQESATPVFRLNSYQSHFFTANITEFLHSVNNGWNYEGIGWYLNNTAGANKPVYRLRGDYYFYTASEYEKNFLISKGWVLEGVAWYVPQSSTAPVYRVNGDYHFYTASSAERDYLVARGWRNEGTAW